jgi:hypothetical protein
LSTADLAVIAVTALSLAHGCWDYRIRMRMADRTRVVSPPKPKQDERDSAAKNPDGKTLKAAS